MIDVLIAAGMWIAAWVFPATVSAGTVALVIVLLKLAGVGPWYVWLLLAPSLYAAWLFVFLLVSAWSIKRVGSKAPKPRRALLPGTPIAKLRTVLAASMRKGVVDSMPLISLVKSTYGSRLAMLAASPSIRIGRGALLAGDLKDPDLTELGDDVTLGFGAMIVAHVMTTLPNGKRTYTTAPVKIGSRVTIGGYSIIMLGCTIGDDAMIQPHSYVLPHTRIPAGEIWGGRPAVFVGKRTLTDPAGAASSVAGPAL
jgi:hypothetical protein